MRIDADLRGTLFLVVGPSGAGKDTLIAAARTTLGSDYVLPRRVITRAAAAGGEDHEAVDAATFAARERAGAFALSWRAHGFAYGIPATIAAELERGRHVVVNASRAVVDEARTRFAPARVILVTAPADVLQARLKGRGREADDAIEARLERGTAIVADEVIVNDTTPEAAVRAFLSALQG